MNSREGKYVAPQSVWEPTHSNNDFDLTLKVWWGTHWDCSILPFWTGLFDHRVNSLRAWERFKMVQCDGQRESAGKLAGEDAGETGYALAYVWRQQRERHRQGTFPFSQQKWAGNHAVILYWTTHCKCFQIPDLCDICILPRDLYLHTYVQKVKYFST